MRSGAPGRSESCSEEWEVAAPRHRQATEDCGSGGELCRWEGPSEKAPRWFQLSEHSDKEKQVVRGCQGRGSESGHRL